MRDEDGSRETDNSLAVDCSRTGRSLLLKHPPGEIKDEKGVLSELMVCPSALSDFYPTRVFSPMNYAAHATHGNFVSDETKEVRASPNDYLLNSLIETDPLLSSRDKDDDTFADLFPLKRVTNFFPTAVHVNQDHEVLSDSCPPKESYSRESESERHSKILNDTKYDVMNHYDKQKASPFNTLEKEGSTRTQQRNSLYTTHDSSGMEVKVYRTRFWILGMFSLLAFLQTTIWGTFGPISASSKSAYGWEDSTIAILQDLGPLSVIVFIVPTTWFCQTYGLRMGVFVSISLMTVGTGLRCITAEDTPFTVTAFLGAIANGISGCIGLSLPATVAATWFPPKERTTATAVASLSAQLGGAGMYLSPLLVREVASSVTSVKDIKADIMLLMYIEFAITVSVFLCIAFYFPEKPALPPSVSAGTKRETYFLSVKILMRNKRFLIVLTTFIFSFGIPVVWISIMNFSLNCIGINQKQAMWIGISASILSAIAAFIVARVTDYLYGYLRISIIGLLTLSCLFFLWLLLLINEVIPPSFVQVYISVVGGIAFEYATVPLLIDFSVELAYPCSESVVGGLLTGMFNVVAGIFLLVFIIPSQCYYWVTYVLVACTSLTVLPLLFVKETHNRSSLDRA